MTKTSIIVLSELMKYAYRFLSINDPLPHYLVLCFIHTKWKYTCTYYLHGIFAQGKIRNTFCRQCTVASRASSRDVISVAVNHSFQRIIACGMRQSTKPPFGIRQIHDMLSGDFVAATFHLTLAVYAFWKN